MDSVRYSISEDESRRPLTRNDVLKEITGILFYFLWRMTAGISLQCPLHSFLACLGVPNLPSEQVLEADVSLNSIY